MVITFKCFYDRKTDSNSTYHKQELEIEQIPRWIEAYKFTHPECTAISVGVRFNEEAKE